MSKKLVIVMVLVAVLALVIAPAAAQSPVVVQWFIGLGTGTQDVQQAPQKQVVDDFNVTAPKTKDLAAKLKSLGLSSALIVTENLDENLFLAARNLPFVDVRDVAGLDPVALIAYDKVVVTVPALKQVEEALA